MSAAPRPEVPSSGSGLHRVLVYSDRDDLAGDLIAWACSRRAALGDVAAAVLGESAAARAEQLLQFGTDRVYWSDHPALDGLADDVVAAALGQLAERSQASLLLIGATRRGRSVAPRVAQLLGAGCVNEAIALQIEGGQLSASRYALGGNTVAREVVRTPRAVVSVLPGITPRAAPGESSGAVEQVDMELAPSRLRVVEQRAKPGAVVDIGASERLVCVGRGLAQPDDLASVEELARALGADVACSRAISYEYGWLPEDRMIGISGKKCSPHLLLSLGVSGQVQHTVGISGAKTIVAVNTDRNAPIFKLADYGIVGDLYKIVPLLIEQLR